MCCGYTKKYKGFLGKIRFIFSFHSLIDLISFVPSLIFPGLNETFLFRIFRIFRMLIASIVLYLAEGKAQPEAFGSIIRSFWWSTITLTTIGYGDVYPITILGKIATTIIAIAGIGIVALPAGIIAGSFSEIVNKKKR